LNHFGTGRVPKHSGDAGAPLPWDGSTVDHIQTRSYLTHVTIPNLVTLGQIVWVRVGDPENLGTLMPCS